MFSHSVVVEPGVAEAEAEATEAEADLVAEAVAETVEERTLSVTEAVGLETDPVPEGVSPVPDGAADPAQVVPVYRKALNEYHPPHDCELDPRQVTSQASTDGPPPPDPKVLPQ